MRLQELVENTSGAFAAVSAPIGSMQRRVKKVKEDSDSREAVSNAISRRILTRHPELLQKYGPVQVMDAIDSVADFVGDVDEIGTSDVSGWVNQVADMLEEHGDSSRLGETNKYRLKPPPGYGDYSKGAHNPDGTASKQREIDREFDKQEYEYSRRREEEEERKSRAHTNMTESKVEIKLDSSVKHVRELLYNWDEEYDVQKFLDWARDSGADTIKNAIRLGTKMNWRDPSVERQYPGAEDGWERLSDIVQYNPYADKDMGLEEAAPFPVRMAAGAGLGALSGTGGVILGSMLGGIFAPILGGYSGYQGAKLGMKAADDIWDWASRKLGGKEEDAAFAHIRASAAGKDTFEFNGKEYEVTLPKTDVNKAIQAVKQVAESRLA